MLGLGRIARWLAAGAALSLSRTHLADGLIATQGTGPQLLQMFLSSQNQYIQGSSATTSGPASAFGQFTQGTFGLTSGVVLTTGSIAGLTSSKPDLDHGPRGVQGDAVSLVITTTPQLQAVFTFNYVFASLETPEYGGREYNDVFTMEVNGINRALLSDGRLVTINNLTPSISDRSRDSVDYINNPTQTHFGFKGYTKVLSLQADSQANQVNTINISIVDVFDGQYDSAVFLQESSFNIIMPITYSYQTGQWGACSVTCGSGTNQRQVTCISSQGQSVPLSSCQAQGFLPQQTRQCNADSCTTYGFQYSDFGPCSVTCGQGFQTRQVLCRGDNGVTVDNSYCIFRGTVVPTDTTRTCSAPSCVSYAFEYLDWGPCSVTCGTGFNQRKVICRGTDGSQVDSSLCLQRGAVMPTQTSQSCILSPCTTYTYQYGLWGPCSVTCGAGVKQRTVQCVGSDGRSSPTSCTIAKPTDLSVACEAAACRSYSYSYTAWSSCSTTCGPGTVERQVTCMDDLGQLRQLTNCAGPLPTGTSLSCNVAECVKYGWVLGEWAPCDRTCGGGQMVKKVTCMGSDGQKYPDYLCQSGGRPIETKECAMYDCINYRYSVSFWCARVKDPCSSPTLKMQRFLNCVDQSGFTQPVSNCDTLGIAKPIVEQTCQNIGICPDDGTGGGTTPEACDPDKDPNDCRGAVDCTSATANYCIANCAVYVGTSADGCNGDVRCEQCATCEAYAQCVPTKSPADPCKTAQGLACIAECTSCLVQGATTATSGAACSDCTVCNPFKQCMSATAINSISAQLSFAPAELSGKPPPSPPSGVSPGKVSATTNSPFTTATGSSPTPKTPAPTQKPSMKPIQRPSVAPLPPVLLTFAPTSAASKPGCVTLGIALSLLIAAVSNWRCVLQ